ncbi:MAG: ABC transporter ATP-binding protein, partial [Steroidobacteraceae bacterium]
LSLEVRAGECVAVVGESGSGKTQALLACLGLLADNGVARGSVRFRGRELLGGDEAAFEAVRGTGMAYLPQDPLSSLTPHLRIGTQLTELVLERRIASQAEARQRALGMLQEVGIDEPEARLRQYPHELSGGMRQRVALAIALMGEPQLLLADEPTTALDVSVQARILELLVRVRRRGLGILIVTHDLGVVAGLADRVAVMYAGRVVEHGATAALFAAPSHPYTAALLQAVPRLAGGVGRLATITGQPPRPGEDGPGCAFAPRCTRSVGRCRAQVPSLEPSPAEAVASHGPRAVACHRPLVVQQEPA